MAGVEELRGRAVAAHIRWSEERAALQACEEAIDSLPGWFEDQHPGPLAAIFGARDRAARRASLAGDGYESAVRELAAAAAGGGGQDTALRAHLAEWEYDWRGADDGSDGP